MARAPSPAPSAERGAATWPETHARYDLHGNLDLPAPCAPACTRQGQLGKPRDMDLRPGQRGGRGGLTSALWNGLIQSSNTRPTGICPTRMKSCDPMCSAALLVRVTNLLPFARVSTTFVPIGCSLFHALDVMAAVLLFAIRYFETPTKGFRHAINRQAKAMDPRAIRRDRRSLAEAP